MVPVPADRGAAAAEELAPAKVNLFLHVLGQRADGFHVLDSLAVFAGAADRLRVTPAATLSLELAGAFGAALAAEPDNLVLRAACALAAAGGIAPTGRLRLEKALPVASGIGGGSADAAAALRLLSRWWGLAAGAADLAATASGLGADVPVCLAGRPARMGGVGEVLGPAPRLPRCGLVLVNPGVPVATAAVFRARTGAFSAPAGTGGTLGGRRGDGGGSCPLPQRPGSTSACVVPRDRYRAGSPGVRTWVPAGTHERLRRHLLRNFPRARRGGGRGGSAGAARLVVLGRRASRGVAAGAFLPNATALGVVARRTYDAACDTPRGGSRVSRAAIAAPPGQAAASPIRTAWPPGQRPNR